MPTPVPASPAYPGVVLVLEDDASLVMGQDGQQPFGPSAVVHFVGIPGPKNLNPTLTSIRSVHLFGFEWGHSNCWHIQPLNLLHHFSGDALQVSVHADG